MVRFSVITLFPEWITGYCETSIIGRAQAAGIISVEAVNPRDFASSPHYKVDDAPYGGGVGMVMACDPLMKAYRHLLPLAPNHRVLLTSPSGQPLDHAMAQSLATVDQIVILCGHYEGMDARLFDLIPGITPVSVGDFVLTGGELPALCILDATTRLLSGALGKEASSHEESFSQGLLEYPQYTRPPVYEGLAVPPVLLSGDHGRIARWRRKMSLHQTRTQRPDLLVQDALTDTDRALLAELVTESLGEHSQ